MLALRRPSLAGVSQGQAGNCLSHPAMWATCKQALAFRGLMQFEGLTINMSFACSRLFRHASHITQCRVQACF